MSAGWMSKAFFGVFLMPVSAVPEVDEGAEGAWEIDGGWSINGNLMEVLGGGGWIIQEFLIGVVDRQLGVLKPMLGHSIPGHSILWVLADADGNG
jgi:hypothetical protein